MKKRLLLISVLASILALPAVGSTLKVNATTTFDYALTGGSVDLDISPYDDLTDISFGLNSDLSLTSPVSFESTSDKNVTIYLNGYTVSPDDSFDSTLPLFNFFDTNVTVTIYGGSHTNDTHLFYKNSTTGYYDVESNGRDEVVWLGGGTIFGGQASAINSESDASENIKLNIFDLNVVGNNKGITCTHSTVNIYNSLIAGNYNSHIDNGSGLTLSASKCLIKNSVIKHNYSPCGSGIDMSESGCRLLETSITENLANGIYGDEGAGVFFSLGGCMPKGTKINLSDGSTKNIEDIKEGDYVLTFDHETGHLNSNYVYNLFKTTDLEKPFILNFTNDIRLGITKGHGLFCQEKINMS